MQKIAILGATSHIAKNLIRLWLADPSVDLDLFARNPAGVDAFVKELGSDKARPALGFERFDDQPYGAVVNCVGFGNPSSLKQAGLELFRVTEDFDRLVMTYLEKRPETLYLNLSSGAVYRGAFSAPVDLSTPSVFAVNELKPADFYSLAKLYSEARHRAASWARIVDIRVFSFFSRHIDPDAGFLLSEILACLKEKRVFETGSNEIVRDYIHPEDLLALIKGVIAGERVNRAVDAYSLNPVSKFELLDYFKAEWDLKVRVLADPTGLEASGAKDVYYSKNQVAARLFDYSPRFSSLDSIASETQAYFNR